MAKKPYAYNELSNIRCTRCGKRLKKNLIARKPTAQICYVCYSVERKNKEVSYAR